jgi:hypothetical protein
VHQSDRKVSALLRLPFIVTMCFSTAYGAIGSYRSGIYRRKKRVAFFQ